MENNAIKLLIEKILENIPSHIKPVDYLMEVLGMSRNAVYRRLKHEKSFSFNEIVKLSSLLGFSLDEIVSTTEDIWNNGSSSKLCAKMTTENSVTSLFEHFSIILKRFENAHSSQFIITADRLHFLSINDEEPLFRFLYYELMHQLREIPVNYPFSQITIPETVHQLSKEFHKRFISISHKEYIIDSNLYLNIVRDIQYFYKKGLISEKELLNIKENLRTAIKHTQMYMQMGINDLPLKKSKFYLSGMEVTSNTVYTNHNGNEESNFWLYAANPFDTNNKRICHIHKLWIDSLMRSSTLISGINENVLFEFISKQLDIVDHMDKIMY